MKKNLTIINPRYSETDQMGIIHHANYLIYMEQARIEWLDALGFSYVKMEEDGVLLPVYNINITYKKPIKFGSSLTVFCELKKIPSTRVEFVYKLIDSNQNLCCEASVILVFTDAQTFRPRRPLVDFVKACEKLFADVE